MSKITGLNSKHCMKILHTLPYQGIQFEVVNINIRSKPQWFLDRNPLGKVPVLEFNEKIVYESAICVEYLDQVYAQNQIQFEDPYERAKQKMLGERLCSQFNPVYYKLFKVRDEETLAAMDNAKELCEELLQTDFYGGSSLGWADVMVWPFFERLEGLAASSDGVIPKLDEDRFPKLAANHKIMRAHPTISPSYKEPETHAGFLRSLLVDGKPNYNFGL